MKNLQIILISVACLCLAGCGSPDSKKQESESTADSVQNNTNPKQDSSYTDSLRSPALNQDRSFTGTDTLITRKYSADADVSDLDKVSGILRYSGNEPFVVPTLYESDSSAYRLIADENFMNETFRSLTGKKVTLYGKERKIGPQEALEVHYYQLFEKQNQQ